MSIIIPTILLGNSFHGYFLLFQAGLWLVVRVNKKEQPPTATKGCSFYDSIYSRYTLLESALHYIVPIRLPITLRLQTTAPSPINER